MNKNDALSSRMKQYENCYRLYLPRRQAVIIRIDGRAFHTFTKGFARPYDTVFADAMQQTALKLAENISGCKFVYTQSDEISLVLVDYENINTEPWLGNNLQKIVSISASMATLYFNNAYRELVSPAFDYIERDEKLREVQLAHLEALTKRTAIFDSRVFIVPREEVFNALYWRQTDCIRNSIQLLGQANFSHNQLQGKNCDEIQEMLWQEHGINWSKEPEWFKNGVAIYKEPMLVTHTMPDGTSKTVERNKWFVDKNIPIFIRDRNFINKHIEFKGQYEIRFYRSYESIQYVM